MRMRRVPRHLQVKVIKWFDYLWFTQKSSDEEKSVGGLPGKVYILHLHLLVLLSLFNLKFQFCNASWSIISLFRHWIFHFNNTPVHNTSVQSVVPLSNILWLTELFFLLVPSLLILLLFWNDERNVDVVLLAVDAIIKCGGIESHITESCSLLHKILSSSSSFHSGAIKKKGTV